MVVWKKYKLSEIGEVVGGATPSTKKPENYDGNISWLTPKDLSTFSERYISKGERSITEEGFNSCSTKMLPKNSILFSSRAPIGYIAIAKKELCTNQGFKSIIPGKQVDYLFLFYLLKYNKSRIEGLGSGTTFKEVSGNVMKGFEVTIPVEMNVQRKIASVLDIIDSKIENNNSINKNLEEQAQALYNNFLIEKNSTKVLLGDIITTANTGADAIQKAPIVEENTGIRCIRVGDMTNNRPIYEWGFAKVSEDNLSRYRLNKDDIVITRTAVLGLNRLIRENLSAVYNNGLIRISINKNKIIPILLYRQMQTKDYFNYINRIESETSVRPNMKINYLLNYTVPLTTLEEQTAIAAKLETIYLMQENLIDENNKLSNLRDALLPKLMSGELDVSELDI